MTKVIVVTPFLSECHRYAGTVEDIDSGDKKLPKREGSEIIYTKIPDYTPELGQMVSASANALIAIGKEEWIRTRRKKKKPRKKTQQDQLREIEDGLVDSPVEDK